ncbi:Hypothetical protein YALI2_E01438g [Yarrowia lipolytica]|nr:Hypothetical protein YALI2_E01438g [Yarrowia lipolytica]
MKAVVAPGKAWFCTVISAFGIVILGVLGLLFKSGSESMVGSINDPKDGAAVASTIFSAVLVYIILFLLHDNEPTTKNSRANGDCQVSKTLCPSSEGKEEEIIVYGRPLVVPWVKDGVAMFKFSQLIERPLAAADFISLASRYHTIIVDEVPVMTLAKKNEARRLITLLDAAYECRCQLIIRAEANADSLFFPEIDDPEKMKEEADIQAQEMYSDTLQDIENPHRPNVSSYDTPTGQRESDENKRVIKPTNFADTTAFTGEDEKFAYKRAVSRLKEMTQSPHWKVDKWMPLPDSDRPWEVFSKSESYKEQEKKRALTDEAASLASMGFRPVKQVAPNAPKFNESHFWSMISWGDRVPKDEIAARWRKGADVYHK